MLNHQIYLSLEGLGIIERQIFHALKTDICKKSFKKTCILSRKQKAMCVFLQCVKEPEKIVKHHLGERTIELLDPERDSDPAEPLGFFIVQLDK